MIGIKLKGRGYPVVGLICAILVVGLVVAITIPQFSAYRARSSKYSETAVDDEYSFSSRQSAPEYPVVEGRTYFNTEEYDRIYENRFRDASQNPLSTFSIDVDTASYSNVRRFILAHRLPPKDAVRIEEMINYFDYDYPEPEGPHPFSVTTEISECPWNSPNRLIHIGLQGKRLRQGEYKPCNLVFLIDTSGSMSSSNKLPLLKKAFRLLANELGEEDRVAIVAYAGSAGLVLPSTPASQKGRILTALDSFHARGCTAGGEGIRLAYTIARENFVIGGNNRVILATDGDFNVGVSSTAELVRLIEDKRKDDIYLTVCGFGMGNYKDGRMEQITNAGDGNYYYIDNIMEAEKVFVTDMRSTLFTIAKDVKIQIEFNPVKVKAYRLLGYENRILASEDFNDDQKDAGELGPGHTVTVLYEIIPAGSQRKVRQVDPLKYQENKVKAEASLGKEIMTVKLRYKLPAEDVSELIEMPVLDRQIGLRRTSESFRFSAAVAGFGMLLRDSQYKESLTYKDVADLAKKSRGRDSNGYRAEFIRLVKSCALLEG